MLTIISFIFFTALVAIITWFITHKDDHASSKGYFLGGRSLTFPVIAGSLLLTNLSTEQMVGLNGISFRDGISVMSWEVIAVVALALMATFFLPRFLKAGITTVPEFLEKRYDRGARTITNLIFLGAYALILLPIILYSGAKGLVGMLNIAEITGIQSASVNLWLLIFIIGIIGSIYALWGGLRTVAVSDTINGLGLLVGGFMIVIFGLQAVSDGNIFQNFQILKEAAPPSTFNSIGAATHDTPFDTLFTGVILLNLFYWCTNQQIIQRTLGASSLKEGQKGVLLTGGLKLLGPIYLVLPGIIAAYLFAGQGIAQDDAYGMLVRKVLPAPLTGFFAAVLVGAILSSFNSALNATCTLFSLGLYKNTLRPNANEKTVVKSGKVFGWIIAIAAMIGAGLLQGQDSIFGYLQKMNAIYFIPIFAVVVVGLLTKRNPPIAAKVALVVGLIMFSIGYFFEPASTFLQTYLHNFHFIGLVFAILVVLMLIIGAIAPLKTPWTLEDSGAVDMTPWRFAKPVAVLLVILVISIYALLADFSILQGDATIETEIVPQPTSEVIQTPTHVTSTIDHTPNQAAPVIAMSK
ncbi:putative symporter YidK [Poriferisphaera corsica]|uniref:Putative symporter YidK n=1 Tax=Poriferisphaera corsica TaxID=2528020 RepID=A0A517YWK1_9BACT|nr:solute:sodium symporter family transporter [Poriferisphaera corsica]QDU34608.1 putative symporter YidK [Poriferisphaera corsica]